MFVQDILLQQRVRRGRKVNYANVSVLSCPLIIPCSCKIALLWNLRTRSLGWYHSCQGLQYNRSSEPSMRDFYLSMVWVALRRVALLHAAVMLFQCHHYEITLKLASTESGKRDQLNSAISSDQEFADMNCYGTNADNCWELPWSHQGR